ncbi:ras association domain-containing protein 3 isoform X1 [Rana temporaria]|uniref:ras association domain-containing protein 3 isoform X1 n=1 Tax=Rana temporaria TaxID=8407 RepID=UPI001AAC474A|nr:ras association domain-containing protein 3 isoform X1 [Rana temporaria]
MSALARFPAVRVDRRETPIHSPSRGAIVGGPPGVRRRVRAHRPPPDVRYIFQPLKPGGGHKFDTEAALTAWCDLCCAFIFSGARRCADCKYTCHSQCQGQVQLNCEPNGKLMECPPAYDTLDQSNNNDKEVEKERDPLSYLSKEETKEKVQLYNAAVTDKLKMTQNSNGIYTGFIKVQMELRRPITVRARTPVQSHANGNNTAFYLPKGSINILHISSTNTVREVIEALLKKFTVADNPAKFALYKRCQKEDQVCMCRLSDRENPLYLRLVAGPNSETLSFVLREHETGDVMWDAFSVPELQNFLRILDKEEKEQLQTLKRRYSSYKEKLEEALSGVHKPG